MGDADHRALVPKYGQSNNQRLVEQQVPSKVAG